MYSGTPPHASAEPPVTIQQLTPLLLSTPVTPTAMEPYRESLPVVWVPDAYGRMVPMPKHLAPPRLSAPEPRDLTPLPLLDPVAQRFIGAGIGGGALSAGVGYGVGQLLNALAGLGSGALIWLAILVIALRAPAITRTRGGSTVHIRKAVIKRNHFHG